MILYLILRLFNTLVTFGFSLFPVLETPAWLTATLPSILNMIFGLDYYLPVSEAFGVVVFLIGFTINYKIAKIILNKTGLDITKS